MKIIKRLRVGSTKGQGMVEMAIIAPILIFFLIGIFEVGWALRNYLVLVNANREITRFAIRPGYMNFSTQANVTTSFERVRDWMQSTVSGQLQYDFDKTTGDTTLIISHLVIDTGLPCKPPDPPNSPPPTCNCKWFDRQSSEYDPNNPNVLKEDDIIIHPAMENYGYQKAIYGPLTSAAGISVTTRLNYDNLASELADQNNKFNCELIEKHGIPSANNVIATELYHDQPQLFGFPIISNPFTDPFPLYTHTVMRLTGGARASGAAGGNLLANIDTIGQVCFAHPFIVSQDVVDGLTLNQPFNILDEDAAANKGWVLWQDPGSSDVNDIIKYEIQFPQMSVNGYDDPTEPPGSDTLLNEGDGVLAENGGHIGVVQQYVENWFGKDIIIPVYDPALSDSTIYHVSSFIKVKITEVHGNQVIALYEGAAPDSCTSPPPPP